MNKKFRIWDKKYQVMNYSNKYACLSDFFKCHGYQYHAPSESKDNYILMQYTDRRDTDNQEIYEGDIVHTEVWLSGSRKEDFVGVVEWNNPCLTYRVKDKDRDYYESLAHNDWEKLGNIYEDKDLVEDYNLKD